MLLTHCGFAVQGNFSRCLWLHSAEVVLSTTLMLKAMAHRVRQQGSRLLS